MAAQTLFDKLWNAHVVHEMDNGPTQLYVDRLYCHEVTSPQAFDDLRNRKLSVFRPERVVCIPDHNLPTVNQHMITDEISKHQIDLLDRNAKEFQLKYFPIGHLKNGIIHVVGPETGLSLPGMSIICGDSHTSTHGALGALAFGVGTSEVAMVLATQCLLVSKPKTMRITVRGSLQKCVTAKDVALYIISKVGVGGATGFFVEYAGETIENLSVEGRMTLCNMSIEMGARGGMVAPDEKTFRYIQNKEYAPKGEDWKKSVEKWNSLRTDDDAIFDKELEFSAEDIEPRITYGTNPEQGISITGKIPFATEINKNSRKIFRKALKYMDFSEGEMLMGKTVDYVFLGSCTNGRIEDFRIFASAVKGKHKAENITAWLVPGSVAVRNQIVAEGLEKILNEAGFEVRQPSCSACLAMNEDKVPNHKLVVSTSNRNFEGRQGKGARTILASPLVAATAAVTGKICDPRTLF